MGSCPSDELSRVGSCPSGELFWWGVVLVGNCFVGSCPVVELFW